MKHLEDMSTEALAALYAESESALRFATYHGAELPEAAGEALLAMAAELRARREREGEA